MIRNIVIEQARVRQNIYNFMKTLGLEPQKPENVAIRTENDYHYIIHYPFNIKEHFGYFEYWTDKLTIPVDYTHLMLMTIVAKSVINAIRVKFD